MKTLVLILSLIVGLQTPIVRAGDELGNPGTLKTVARGEVSGLIYKSISIALDDLKPFGQIVPNLTQCDLFHLKYVYESDPVILVTDEKLYWNKKEQTALNYPNKNLIKVNYRRFEREFRRTKELKPTKAIVALSLHELLGLARLETEGEHHLSGQYSVEYSNIRAAGYRDAVTGEIRSMKKGRRSYCNLRNVFAAEKSIEAKQKAYISNPSFESLWHLKSALRIYKATKNNYNEGQQVENGWAPSTPSVGEYYYGIKKRPSPLSLKKYSVLCKKLGGTHKRACSMETLGVDVYETKPLLEALACEALVEQATCKYCQIGIDAEFKVNKDMALDCILNHVIGQRSL